jgi:hypothetical protein
MYTPVMCDFTNEDRARGSVEKEKGLFSFLPKIEVLSSYVELACVQELSKRATGVQLNGCTALWVCSLTGFSLPGLSYSCMRP